MTSSLVQPPAHSLERPAHVPPPVLPSDAVLRAIYGDKGAAEKKAELEGSLRAWWAVYAERKDDEDEHVADTLLYDKTHLPRTAPAPDCCVAPVAAKNVAGAAALDATAVVAPAEAIAAATTTTT